MVESETTVGQSIDSEAPRFKVVLVDGNGVAVDRIGFWFYSAGAQATANAWNALSADERNGLKAWIEGYNGEDTDTEVDATSQEEGDSEADSEVDTDTDTDTDTVKADERYTNGVGVFEGNDSYELCLMVDEAQQAADRGDFSQMATVGMRYLLCRYLLTVIQATMDNEIRNAFDIGMIAKGLERFCAQMIEGDDREELAFCEWSDSDFRLGYNGEITNDYATEEALSAWFNARLDERDAAALQRNSVANSDEVSSDEVSEVVA